MKRTLKTYKLEMKVLGPVFIGSGNEIKKKEYIFLKPDLIGVTDPARLYNFAKKKGLRADLEKFLVQDTRESLAQWRMRNKISMNEMNACMKYVVNTGDIQKGNMQIMSCMKDPYGNPYVPGSSVKGMLRTILLGAEILADSGRYARPARNAEDELRTQNQKRNRLLTRSAESLENSFFYTEKRTEKGKDEMLDWMSGVIVSDSEPLSMEDVILCQKWDQHVKGECKSLNLLRECLKPGTVIHCDLTIDETMCHFTGEDIMEAVKRFYDNYYETYQSKFPKNDRGSDRTVFLGGGSGFVSKTVIYNLFHGSKAVEITQEILKRTGDPRQPKNAKDIRMGISPHILKCTFYQGKQYMMGQCEINIY